MGPVRAVPTTVITGWLGIGKTTAILDLFQHRPPHERWAVLVNELGEVGLDGAILDAGTGSAVKEIPGGCICCTAGPELQIGLSKLLGEVRPDRLLVEPTGLAAPSAVLDALRLPWFRESIDVRATIALVDPRRFLADVSLQPETWREQVEVGDVLVGNKADLCTGDELARFRAEAAALWPPKLVVATTTGGRLDPAWLDLSPPERPVRFVPASVAPLSGALVEKPHVTDTARQGWIFPPEVVFDWQRLRDALAALVVDADVFPAGVLRVKGIFHTTVAWVLAQGTDERLGFGPIAHRRDSRVEWLAPASPPPDWEAVARALDAARA